MWFGLQRFYNLAIQGILDEEAWKVSKSNLFSDVTQAKHLHHREHRVHGDF
jgi:hypothetical protein